MSGWLAELGPAEDGIRGILVTVDPERDTVEILDRYISSFDDRVVALTAGAGAARVVRGKLQDLLRQGHGHRWKSFKTRTCACCVAWTDRLRESGFAVEVQDLPMADLMIMKLDLGITKTSPAAIPPSSEATCSRATCRRTTSSGSSRPVRTPSGWRGPACRWGRLAWNTGRGANPST